MKRAFLLATVTSFAALGACKSQTAIVVTVDTTGIKIPESMDRIQVVVRSADGTGAEKTLVSGDLTTTSAPYSATIVRTTDTVSSVIVRVRGLKGSLNVGDSGEVEIPFKDNTIVRHTIALSVVSGCQDLDLDGFYVGVGCPPELPTDCDDSDNKVYPGAPERCNGKDDNCDDLQLVDEDPDPSTSGCPPRQGVCEGIPVVCVSGRWDCGLPPEYAETENCDDRLDNNCDGTVNEGCPCTPEDEGQPCGSDLGECTSGTWQCAGPDRVCVDAVGPTDEICDSLDNNCDGHTDEEFGVGDICVAGLGMCQTDGHIRCQTAPPFDSECVADLLMPDPQPENCNDETTRDEDCDGHSNEDDTESCPLSRIWASRCLWEFELDDDGPGHLAPCIQTISVGLFAESGNPPPALSRQWVVVQESFPDTLSITSLIPNPHALVATLQVTATPLPGGPIIDLTDQFYEATVRFNISDNSDVTSYYVLHIKVSLCLVNNCAYGAGYMCVNDAPTDPYEESGLSCAGVIVN